LESILSDGTDLASAAASALASVNSQESADTQPDTASAAGHTPEAAPVDESDSHIQWLKDNLDKIPAEKISFVDKKFQPDYTRKLNLMNQRQAGFEQSAQAVLAEQGIRLPEGKSVSDLMYEDNGKPFVDLLRSTVKEQMAPVLEQANAQKRDQHIQQMMNVAVQAFPEVKENYQAALAMIDSDPDLLALATQTNAGANALPYVLRGAALAVKAGKQEAEIADLKKQLGIAKVATKVGTSTSKVSGGTAKTSESKPTSLKEFAKLALDQVKDA
jgi:hypothetical protein